MGCYFCIRPSGRTCECCDMLCCFYCCRRPRKNYYDQYELLTLSNSINYVRDLYYNY